MQILYILFLFSFIMWKGQLTWKHMFTVFMKENILEIVKLEYQCKIIGWTCFMIIITVFDKSLIITKLQTRDAML